MRRFLYETLNEYPPLRDVHEGRVFQGESMLKAPQAWPFLVYRMGNETDEQFSESRMPKRHFFQVYIHDQPADYQQIDSVMALVRDAFKAAGSSPEDNIMQIVYLETSRDLDDPTLGTIMRYMRFQLILSD